MQKMNLLILCLSFRPQQGLTIMNRSKGLKDWRCYHSFRPQQGLTIMNAFDIKNVYIELRKFPSPTGVNYYELNNDTTTSLL